MKTRISANPSRPTHVYSIKKSSQLLLRQQLIHETRLRRPMHHRPGIVIVVLFLLLDLHLVLHDGILLRGVARTTQPDGTRPAHAPPALAARDTGRRALGGCVEVVDDLAQADVELVQGVAPRGVRQQLVFDGLADGGVDVAGGGLGRRRGDVQLAEEGGDDFLFFFCRGGSVTFPQTRVSQGGTYSARFRPTSRVHPAQTPNARLH